MYIKAVVDCIVIYALIKSVTKHISIKAPIKFDLHAKKLKPTNIYVALEDLNNFFGQDFIQCFTQRIIQASYVSLNSSC